MVSLCCTCTLGGRLLEIDMKQYLLVFILLFLSCKQEKPKQLIAKTTSTEKPVQKSLLNSKGTTIKTRFKTPKGYTRIKQKNSSFQFYLQNFPLKADGEKVHLYNGELKGRQNVHAAILSIDVGKRDLQQCADATMRLRAEYLFKQKQFDKIHFNFTNGFKADYAKWRKGNRISVKGNNVSWYTGGEIGDSRKSFNRYLNMVFSYAGTLSLAKEMQKVTVKDMQIGDVFIQGGSPGHSVIIVDMAKNINGDTIFMIAQSYMPAQDIHVLKNFNNNSISPWYSATDLEELHSPEWTFTKNHLKRFQ